MSLTIVRLTDRVCESKVGKLMFCTRGKLLLELGVAVDDDEQHKDVFAHFGLALYLAQVLEHGLVNALLVADYLPRELGRQISKEAWEEDVDAFMDDQFLSPMGRLVRRLERVWKAPDGVEEVLHQALV